MNDIEFVNGLLEFIKKSPTPFHVVKNMKNILQGAGFEALTEADSWARKNKPNLLHGKFYLTRNDSSIIAFQTAQSLAENGFNMIAAHTDSPCLKLKPNPEIIKHHYLQLGVEVYGGALLNPWFDRDLSLAGRVSYLDQNNQIKSELIDFEKAIAIIPSLAIHLDRAANTKRTVNAQKHLPPILMKLPEKNIKVDFNQILLKIINAQTNKAVEILNYELSFYDMQAPAVVGLHDDFIASARLDNLLSCYIGLMALVRSDGRQNCLLACNDHEEVGSLSAAGAQGTLLNSVLERLTENSEDKNRLIANSLLISADNAHGIHPNYSDKHDENHAPILNDGVVIKINANQKYASDSESCALFKQLCMQADVPVQSFVVRSDMACGSTLGPITAAELGIKTVDVGVPTFAMHSIRELAGRWDGFYLYRALCLFFRLKK